MSVFEFKAHKPPTFNEPIMTPGTPGIVTRPGDYDELDFYITRTPELIRIVAAVQEDVLGDGIYFTGADSAVKKAQDFWDRNFMKEELKKAMFDWLLYGDGYLWKGHFTKSQLEGAGSRALSKVRSFQDIPDDFGPNVTTAFKARDEDSINVIRHAPSSTMNIHLNIPKTAIDFFQQIISGIPTETYRVNEIVHAKYWTVSGKVYGFSPAMSLIVELQAIGYIKDYATGFFKEGGWPDWLFSFKNEPAKSPRIREMVEKLQKYKHPIHKHGNLVVGGDLTAQKLNDFGKDMEFRQLLIQLTGIIAHAYGLPAGRISSIIGAEVKVSTGSDDLANEAYWAMIRNHKDYWEELLNSQIFSTFGKVKIQFPQSHKVDEVRVTMSKLQTVDYINGLLNMGVELTPEYVKDKFGLKSEDVKKIKLMSGMDRENARQNFQKIGDLEKDTAKQGFSNEKKKQQQTDNSDKQKLGI